MNKLLLTLTIATMAVGCASTETAVEDLESTTVAESSVSAMQRELENQPPPASLNRKTCRIVQTTGSHMHRRECYTEAERREMEARSKDWMRTKGASGSPVMVRDSADPRDQ